MHIILIFIEIVLQLFFIQHAIKYKKPFYWIIILLIPVAGMLFYFVSEFNIEQKQDFSSDNQNKKIKDSLAYISNGKLFYLNNSGSALMFQSSYGQELIDRSLRINQSKEWQTKQTGSHFSGSMLWGTENISPETIKVNITSASKTKKNDTINFILESEAASGLFSYNFKNNEEKRLFHKNNFRAKDLSNNMDTGEIVCSQMFPDGTANIALMKEDGSDLKSITGGDSIDESPSWIPDKKRWVIFQSSGIARTKEGYAVGKGPSSIQVLDLENTRMTEVLSDNNYDFILPKISKDGFLYFIRRPYENIEFNAGLAFLDFILLPFRLLRAFFHYLNFFSMVYSRKPLTSASGPKVKGEDFKSIILKGKRIDAEKALKKGTKISGVPSLVPSSWELVKRSPDNREIVVAKNVASFDIDESGIVRYSNGCGIFQLNENSSSSLILKDNIIEDVFLL